MRATLLAAGAFLVVPVLFVLPAPASAQDADVFRNRCGVGDLPACDILGLMYETGEGAGRSADRAIEAYRRACEGGEAAGCTSIGLLYDNGTIVDEDDDVAREWYRRACDQSELFACDLLVAIDHEGPIQEARPFFKVGRVGDANSGDMLADALVEVPRLGIQAVSDGQGRVTLERIPEGTYDLRAEVLGYEPVRGVLHVPGYAEFVTLLQPLEWHGPAGEAGRIAGAVRDSADVPLPDVEVSVVGRPRVRTLTDRDGNFLLTGVAPGLAVVRFSLLGFATRETKLIVQPGASARVVAAMATDPIELDPIEVSVEERSAYLARNGFYDRARKGIGQHFTPRDFYGLNPVYLSDVFYQVHGVSVSGLDEQGRAYARSTRAGPGSDGSCRLDTYIDGTKTLDGNVNMAPLAAVEAIEVYLGLEVPPQYGRVHNCGVILIWTTRP